MKHMYNAKELLTKSEAYTFDNLVIWEDGKADIHTANGVTIEQLEEVLELMKKVRAEND